MPGSWSIRYYDYISLVSAIIAIFFQYLPYTITVSLDIHVLCAAIAPDYTLL